MPRLQKINKDQKNSAVQSSPPEKPRVSRGEIALLLTQFFLGGLSWVTIKWSLTGWSPAFLPVTIGLFCLFLAVMVINSILNKDRKRVLLVWLAGLLWIPIWFGISFSAAVGMFLGALAGLFLIGHMSAQSKKLSRQDFWLLTKSGLELTLMLLMLTVSLAYFGYLKNSATSGSSTIERIQNAGSGLVEKILIWKIPNYNQDMTLDTVVNELAKEGSKQITDQMVNSSTGQPDQNSNADIQFEDLPPEQQQEIIAAQQRASEDALNQELTRQRDELLQKYNVAADGNSSIGSVIDQLVSGFLGQFLGPFASWVDHIIVFGLFLTLLATTPIYRLIIRIFTVLLAKIFLAVKIISVHKEKREVEVIEFN